MKKSITVLLLTIITSFIYSQDNNNKVLIKWGEEQKGVKLTRLLDIVGTDATGFYTVNLVGMFNIKYSLEHYDKNMKLINSLKLESEFKDHKTNYDNVKEFGNKIYLFTTYNDTKQKLKILLYQIIDKKTLTLTSKCTKLAEIDCSKHIKSNSGYYDYKLSRDSTKLLVFYNMPYEKYDNEKFGYHVFDVNFNELWGKEITLPYSDEHYTVNDYLVDNNGNVHILGKLYKEKKEDRERGKPNYYYQIESYYNNGEKWVEYPIDFEDKYLTDMIIAVMENQDLICSGFYSD